MTGAELARLELNFTALGRAVQARRDAIVNRLDQCGLSPADHDALFNQLVALELMVKSDLAALLDSLAAALCDEAAGDKITGPVVDTDPVQFARVGMIERRKVNGSFIDRAEFKDVPRRRVSL